MRVLHIGAGNLFGGIEVLFVTLARSRDSCPEMEPHFALCFEAKAAARLRNAGAAVHILGAVRLSRPWQVWRVRRRLRALLAATPFDLVICHECWAHAVFGLEARKASLPLVFWAHDVHASRNLLDRLARRTRPDLVICNSKYSRASMPEYWPNVRAEVLYCPVAPPAPLQTAVDRMAVRQRLNTAANAVVIVQVGRWEAHKGHLVHLEALARLQDVPGWVCWQVGSPQRAEEERYCADVRALAQRLGIADRVRFLGWQPDVHEVLAAADIYCQPNIRPEPFGITFIEALYAGRPVVATSLGGPLEIIDGTCGILVPPTDAEALKQALQRLLRNPDLRASLGSAGPERARRVSDPKTALDLLHALLGQLVQRRAVVSRS